MINKTITWTANLLQVVENRFLPGGRALICKIIYKHDSLNICELCSALI